jgi:hypothetical protein
MLCLEGNVLDRIETQAGGVSRPGQMSEQPRFPNRNAWNRDTTDIERDLEPRG